MMRFDKLDRMAAKSADWAIGERFRLEPRRTPANGRPGPDASRSIVTGTGIYSERAPDAGPLGRPRHTTLTTGGVPSLSVDRDLLNGQLPRQGDAIELAERGAYEVTRVDADGNNRWRLLLVTAGRRGA